MPAPEGVTDDLLGRAIYELNKLGTIESGPYGSPAVEVWELPDEMKPPGAPENLRFARFTANLIPYV